MANNGSVWPTTSSITISCGSFVTYVSKELSITSDEKVFDDIKENNGPNKFLLTVGYAGWEKGQLDKEIKNGDWLVAPADFNFIFKVSDDKKWNISSNSLGFDINKLSGKSGLA